MQIFKNIRTGYTYEVRKLTGNKFVLYQRSSYAFEAFKVLSVGSKAYITGKFNRLIKE